jgi:cytochrome c oxidase subunit II
MPYFFVRRQTIGRPTVRVRVLARQWAWTFSQNKVPARVPVEFDVTSDDVNHGFGLVAQTQAMPGYTNQLIFTFNEPGTYLVRCLELCGAPHFAMQSQIMVIR